jgi:arylsulfatase A-like enzyme
MSDMVTRVPLIIRRPGCPAGHRIKTPVQSFDIMPTILDYESITPEHTHFDRSLGEQVEGKPGEEERAVYCEGGYDTREPYCFEPVCFVGSPLERPVIEGTDYYPKFMQQQEAPESVCRTVMQRYKEWKLVVRTNGQNEFYNMEKDPLEKNNLYGKEEYNDIISELEKKMLAWLIHTSDVPPIKGR